MSLIDMLLDLFTSEEERSHFEDDPTGYLAVHCPEGVSPTDVLDAMPALCGALPPGQAEVVRAAYGLDGPGGAGPSAAGPAVAPPPVPDPGGDAAGQVLSQLDYFTAVTNYTHQSFVDNDVTSIDDRDTTVDASVNQNITAFGNVNQDFDNDVVSGDHAAATGDASPVNTGDGAVQAGGDITDSSDTYNQVIDDSTVGAANFGAGDATDITGTGGDVTLDSGDGDLTQIQDSDDSFDTADSYNPDTTDSYPIHASFDTSDSYNPDNHIDQTTTTTTEDNHTSDDDTTVDIGL